MFYVWEPQSKYLHMATQTKNLEHIQWYLTLQVHQPKHIKVQDYINHLMEINDYLSILMMLKDQEDRPKELRHADKT